MKQDVIGWKVSLWSDNAQTNINNRDEFPFLSWSPYDRITIDEIETFSKFFDIKEKSDWIGTVQRLHLIPLEECKWKPGKEKECLISAQEPNGLYCILTARFESRFKDVIGVEQSIMENLSVCLKDKKIQWQGFRSLGAEDFVCIFLANRVSELAEAVEVVKSLKYIHNGKRKVLFHSVYSFLGLNIPNFDHEPNADLIVRIKINSDYTIKEVSEKLHNDLETVLGETIPEISFKEVVSGRNNLVALIPNHKRLLSCFHNNVQAVFNGNSDFYKQYIVSSRTYWSFSHNCIVSTRDIEGLEIYDEDEWKRIDYSNIEIHPISQFIIKEYERMINSHRCLWWKPILQKQYKTYVEFVKQYTREGNETALSTLNNKVQTVLLHINQATAPVYEIPYHNYYYSGSYNDVLRMYYGIIAAILNLAYKLPRGKGSFQYDITYCVDFEAATKVHSSMYKLNNSNERFVVFHLPYDAFMKFDNTVKFLLHEVFHYVAPYDRHTRNNLFIMTWLNIVFQQYTEFLENILEKEDVIKITEYFYSNFDDFFKIIQNEIGDRVKTKILNEFTSYNKLKRMKAIPEKICEIIHDELTQNVKIKCHYPLYEDIYNELFNNVRLDYLMENLRRVALATKEAFCDLNMIYILNLSLEEYLTLVFDALFKQYDSNMVGQSLEELIKTDVIHIGSFELRIGMVLDNYYYQKENEFDQYWNLFSRDVQMLKNKSSSFDYFARYLTRVYKHYFYDYNFARQLFLQFFAGEEQWFLSFLNNEYSQESLCRASLNKENIYDNISIIRDFIDLEVDTNLLNMDNNALLEIPKNHFIMEKMEVFDLSQYVNECSRMISEWGDKVIWFRGMCSDKFTLTPSIFRNMDKELSLYANQAKYLQAAYYKTISITNLWTETSNLEHMSTLQHYGMPTTLLDFSEDMLFALHFALNPDVADDLRKVDEFKYQPKVILFNPRKYREAIWYMQHGKFPTKKIFPSLLDVNDEALSDYYVSDMSEEKINNSYTPYSKQSFEMKYPQPVAIRRANERIQVQKGTFVAFNLYSHQGETGDYDYLALEKIHEQYKERLRKDNIYDTQKDFIKEIYIYKPSIPIIKEQLKIMDITTARAYPELFRIFAEYMEEIKNTK